MGRGGARRGHSTKTQTGRSQRSWLVEAEGPPAVPCPTPADLKVDLADPRAGLSGRYAGGFLVLLADASARFLRTDISVTTLASAFTRSGGETMGSDWHD